MSQPGVNTSTKIEEHGVAEIPDDFRFTFAWWHNAGIVRRQLVGGLHVDKTAWHKHLSHGGSYDQFAYGTEKTMPGGYGGKCANSKVEHHDEHGHQRAVVCAKQTHLFVVDVDDPINYATSQTARLLGKEQAMTTRGAGWHVYIYVPPELMAQWPRQGVIPGGDVKSNGFVPAPLTVHYSHHKYELTAGASVVVATPEILQAVNADRAAKSVGVGGSGSGDRGDGNEPELFSYAGALYASNPADKEGAWAAWLEHAQFRLTLSDPTWPWTEGDRDIFERHWEYCEKNHAINHPDVKPSSVTSSPSPSIVTPHSEAPSYPTMVTPVMPVIVPVVVPLPPSLPVVVEMVEPTEETVVEGEGGTQPPEPPDDVNELELLQPEDGYQLPPGYELTAKGVIWHHEVGTGRNARVIHDLITVRPLLLTTAFIDDRDETRYEIAWLSDDNDKRTLVVTTRDVSDRTRLLTVFPEVVVTSQHSTAVVEYLTQTLVVNRESIFRRRHRVATALGWFDDAATTYVSGPNRPMAVSDVKNTRAWLTGHHEGGTLEGWRTAVMACTDRPVVQVLITAAFASPLLRLLDAASFVVDVSSSTSQGKTISQFLSAAAWGDPDKTVMSWQMTTVALEHHLSMLRGLPLYLSESQLASDTGVETFIYALVEGHSKGRSRQDGSGLMDQVHWESVPISSGERPLTAFTKKGGVVPRVVTLTGSPFSSAETADAAKEAARDHFGHAGPRFVEKLLTLDRDSLRQAYKKWVETLRTGTVTAVAKRRAESVAVLALANHIAAGMSMVPTISMETWLWLVEGGGASNEDEDDRSRQALDVVLRAVVFNPSAFYRQGSQWADIPPNGGWLGRHEVGQFVGVKPEWLRKLLTDEGYDYTTVVTEWRVRGWVQTTGKRLTRATSISGKNTMVVYITEGVSEIESVGVTDVEIQQLLDENQG